jgi:hypothetical protein
MTRAISRNDCAGPLLLGLLDVANVWKSERVNANESLTVWDRLREYAATQSGPFTSQEALSWFRRHAPSQANDRTVRTHIRGACWNVGDRSQFSKKEPFLTRIDRGLFRLATTDEVEQWRAGSVQQLRTDRAADSVESGASTSGDVSSGAESMGTTQAAGQWHTEANVQALLVTALATDGWRILSVANTATKEHGIDVIAARDGQTAGIEVKGFPSRAFAIQRAQASRNAPQHPSRALVFASRPCSKATTWEGTQLAQRDRPSRLPALPGLAL